jgi:hypothetical protein
MQFVGMGRPVGGKTRTSLECLPILGTIDFFSPTEFFVSLKRFGLDLKGKNISDITAWLG